MTREFASGMPGANVRRDRTFDEVIADAYRILAEKKQKRLKKHGVNVDEVPETTDADLAAQDWYEEYRKEQDLLSAHEVADLRRDDDLPPDDDDLPF